MDEQEAYRESMQVFLFGLSLMIVFGVMFFCLDPEHLLRVDSKCVSTTTTTTARSKESPRLSVGKKEFSASNADPVRNLERCCTSLWGQEDVDALREPSRSQEADAGDVGTTEEKVSEREIEESEDKGNEIDDDYCDDEYHKWDEDEDDDNDDDHDEDDDVGGDGWEVLERSQLARDFERVNRFVGSRKNAEEISNWSNDEKSRFYRLHKFAVEGPCQEPRPATFKLYTPVKWNAWRRVRVMSPEDAMEQYVDFLQERFPHWEKDSFTASASGERDQDQDPKDADLLWKLGWSPLSKQWFETECSRSSGGQARIDFLSSLLINLRLVMNKFWQISFHRNDERRIRCS